MKRALFLGALWSTAACTAPSGGPDATLSTDAAFDAPAGDTTDAATLPPRDVDLPPRWTLETTGIRVDVRRAPYGFTVRDGTGRVVLDSLGDGSGDGYGAVGQTTGSTSWRPRLTQGYYTFAASLDPWRDRWEVVTARATTDELELGLLRAGVDDGVRMTVRHRLRASTLRVEASVNGTPPRAWSAAFQTPADEGFLGFGERFNKTNQRGVDVYNWAEEGGIGSAEGTPLTAASLNPNGWAMSYYPVPFFVSTRGYGFWLDTTWRSEFNLATQRPDAWRVWHIGPSLAYEVYTPTPGDARPWPYHVLDRFTEVTGRPMLPPAWTFGPRRRIGNGSRVGSVSEIQAMRDQDLAITAVDDAVHFLPAGSHVGRESELQAWTQEAARLGYKSCGYYNSLMSTADDNPIKSTVDRFIANRWVLADRTGRPSAVVLISGRPVSVLSVDFTSRDANAAYGSLLSWALDLGYRGWMEDFGEYVQADVVASNGMTGEELHNLYPVLYQKAAYEALEAGPARGDWFVFVRSGYTGAAHWSPMVWSGDPAASFEESDGLPSIVRGGVNMGLSGVAHWGSDIGGFHCLVDGYAKADGELLTRWIEQGAMGSNMQDQNACSGALGTGTKASIWSSDDAKTAWRTYARLHTRLFPYLYSLAHEATRTGAPTMRHLFLEHPDRPELASVDDAYYLGPAILVAPVVHRGERTRTLGLPPGDYLDWQDPRIVTGGTTVTLDAPLTRLPLLLRDGRLVPLLDPAIDTLAPETHPDVVGPSDVATVYDVTGFVSRTTGAASFTLWDGGVLSVTVSGAPAAPGGFRAARDDADLASCTDCERRTALTGGLVRVQFPTAAMTPATAGGVTVRNGSSRRVRWDLYVRP